MMSVSKTFFSALLLILIGTSTAICEESSFFYGQVIMNYSSGKTSVSDAKLELFNASEASEDPLYITYSNSKGVFSFYYVPYGNYKIRVSLGNDILTQQYTNDAGSEIKDIKQPIVVNEPETKRIINLINSRYQIISKLRKQFHKQCMDIKKSSKEKGANVEQRPCYGGSNQLFSILKFPEYSQIKAKHSGQCLDIKNKSEDNGAKVQQWPCSNADHQLFEMQLKEEDRDEKLYWIVAKHSGKCLGVKGNSKKPGAGILQLPCKDGKDNLLWFFSLSGL